MRLDRKQLVGRVAAGTGAAALAGPDEALAALGENRRKAGFPAHPRWKFIFVSHLTTSPLFVPLQYGIQDACALVGCTYRWVGSTRADTGKVVEAVRAAVRARVDGIALPGLDAKALAGPIALAVRAGIPVVTYHAEAARAGGGLAFVGPDSYAAGIRIGEQIARLVRRGGVTLLIAERGVNPVEQRLQGALAGIRRSGARVRAGVLLTTRDPYEAAARIDRHVVSRKGLRGLFALELEASEGVGRAVVRRKLRARGMRAGGYGVLPATLELIKDGKLDFTLDEQPYLQGFVPAIQLFLARISGGLLAPSDVDVRLVFVTKVNLAAYLAKTRYEGSSSRQRYPIS